MLCPACLTFKRETEATAQVNGTLYCAQHAVDALNTPVLDARRGRPVPQPVFSQPPATAVVVMSPQSQQSSLDDQPNSAASAAPAATETAGAVAAAEARAAVTRASASTPPTPTPMPTPEPPPGAAPAS